MASTHGAPNFDTWSAKTHLAAIAFGSNLGDRFYNIELALRLLEVPDTMLGINELPTRSNQDNIVTVVDTSFMYETVPMYVTDQPAFLNCAGLIETNIPPLRLLRLLKSIEIKVGRVPSIRNGPRAIDLDIIFYGNSIIDTRPPSSRASLENLQGELVVPHPRMGEREFVLRPLNDMIPDYIHPVHRRSIRSLLDGLNIPAGNTPMQKVLPFPRYPSVPGYGLLYPQISPVPLTLAHWTFSPLSTHKEAEWKHTTRLMATLNVTPDSFSDGADHAALQPALKYVRSSIEAGASIIDIGGYSTRPEATFVSLDDEVNRVVPIVMAIRRGGVQSNDECSQEGNADLREIPISVDTFRWEVAEASIKAGANCINDVYAFSGPDSYLPIRHDEGKKYVDGMKRVGREYAVPVVLMHSRGPAGQNQDYSKYNYAGREGAVIEGVRVELGNKVDRIVKGKGGIRRWLVITDPGVGFSKTVDGNLEILRRAASITADLEIGEVNERRYNPLTGYPLLIGPSRKSFLGQILAQGDAKRNTTPKERVWATAVAVACAIQQGAVVVRVHDTKEMSDVVCVADRLWN